MERIKRLLCCLLIATTLASGLQGCAKAITAQTVESHAASYDPQDKFGPTSGIVAVAPGGGRIVTQHFRDRFNALVDLYGDQFHPPLKHDEGFDFSREGDTCIVNRASYIKFGQMQQWKRDGKKPTGTVKRFLNKLTKIGRARSPSAPS